MFNELLNEKFNCKLNKIKEKTLFDLVEKDQHYQLLTTELDHVEEKYLSLNLSEEQKAFIDYYLSLNDSFHMKYNTLNYLAGLIDGQKLGALIPVKDTNTTTNAKNILKFYTPHHQSIECYQSTETSEYWKEFHREEEAFSSTLTSEQVIKFKELSAKRLEGIGYSMADSFAYGFQSCSKLLQLLFD